MGILREVFNNRIDGPGGFHIDSLIRPRGQMYSRPMPYWTESQHPRGQPGNSGQFAPSPGGGSSSGNDSARARAQAPQVSSVLDRIGLSAVPPAIKAALSNAKSIASLSGVATLAGRLAYDLAMRAPQVFNLWTTVFDGPEDLQKIGYNPSLGNTGHATADPVKDATGVPAHMATRLVAMIGGAAIGWIKSKVSRSAPTQSSRYALPGDDYLQAAQQYISFTNAILGRFGMRNNVDARQVAANIQSLSHQKANNARLYQVAR